MKLLFVLALLQGHPRRDSWFGVDKVKHFFLSAFVRSVTYGAFRATGAHNHTSLASASATTLVVGVGKELHDRRATGLFSLRDLGWDAAGAGAASVYLTRTVR